MRLAGPVKCSAHHASSVAQGNLQNRLGHNRGSLDLSQVQARLLLNPLMLHECRIAAGFLHQVSGSSPRCPAVA